MSCIIIVDYGLGNLRSIQHKLKKINIDSTISSSPEDIALADALILPGVGHFAKGMQNLRKSGLVPILDKKVLEDKTPIMGVCLGMQLFTRYSEEGDVEGLGWVDAMTRKFNFNSRQPRLRIPHIGWNTIKIVRQNRLLEGIAVDQRFYFVHSYHVVCNNPEDVLATTHYGIDFVSSLQNGNIFGTQFHPEKSHPQGIRVFENFAKYAQERRATC